MGHQFLPFFYVKSGSNLTSNGSFKICSSWQFENTPYMLNLMKFWLRYLGLKTIYIFQKLISFHPFSLPIISNISSSNSKIRDSFFFLPVMRIQKLSLIIEIDKEMTELFKVKPRPNFRKDDKNINWTSSVPF